MSGKLYLVATPIGNLQDITLRALEILKSVDIIACEDTRRTLGMLNFFEIKKPLISYYKGKEKESGEKIIELLFSGKNIALVTDAGMPCISDPGSLLVKSLMENHIEYTVAPGACAFVSAIALTGITGEFTFIGFLPEKKKEKDKILGYYKDTPSNLIFYSAPHDINKTLSYLYETLGKRKAYAVKEITKIYESVIEGELGLLEIENPKGEFVIIIEGAKITVEELSLEDIKKKLSVRILNGMAKKEAVAEVAQDYGISKNTVYKISLDL